MSIGERIVQLRKDNEMSQGDLADALEVTRQAVSKWENDQSSPDTLRLIKLAEVLDTDIEYLATGRRMVYRRPPIVLKSTEVVEKVVEKPVFIEKVVEKPIEKPVVQYIEKPVIQEVPVIKKVYRTKIRRSIPEYLALAIGAFLLGLLIGKLF